MEEGYRLDPLHPTIRRNLGMWYAFTGRTELAREILIPGEQDYYEIEGFIALVEGRSADRERQLDAGAAKVSASEQGTLIWMRNMNRYFQLANREAAYEDAEPLQAMMLDAFLEPERALAALEGLSDDDYGRAAFHAHLTALANLGRHEELMATYEARMGKPERVLGSIFNPVSEFSWMISYAEALKSSGNAEASRALGEKLRAYLARSVVHGTPNVYMVDQARIALILDEPDAAIAALKAGMQYHSLGTPAFEGIWFAELEDNPEYQALREAWIQQVDNERAKLNWPPLELAGL
jgi:hypothetical protein